MVKQKYNITPYSKLKEKVAIVWTRVSSERQERENCSLDTQRIVCERYAEANGIRIKKYCGGQHESGKSEGELYKQMIALACHDKEVNVILVYSFDRFSRSAAAVATKQKLKEQGVYVISATQSSDPDSVVGDFVEDLSIILGKFDNAIRRDKILSGQQGQLERGNWPFQIPLGYERKKQGREKLIVITEQGYLLRQAFILRAQGEKEVDIIARLKELGLNIDRKHLNKLLKNPFYCGLIIHPRLNNKRIRGNHEALIDEDTFSRAQGHAHTGYEQIKDNDYFPLKRHVYCAACGGVMSGYVRVRPKHKYQYYKCNTHGCGVNVEAGYLHNLYMDLLSEYQVDEDCIPEVLSILKKFIQQRHEMKSKIIATIKKDIADLKQKIDGVEYRYALGEIPESAYRVAMERLNQSIVEESQKLKLQEDNFSNTLRTMHQVVLFSSRLVSCWQYGDLKRRQEIQKIAFPMGIKYNKEKGISRTLYVNEVILVIRNISDYCKARKTKSDSWLNQKSPFVEKRRLERPTPTSRTWCATNCATSRKRLQRYYFFRIYANYSDKKYRKSCKLCVFVHCWLHFFPL